MKPPGVLHTKEKGISKEGSMQPLKENDKRMKTNLLKWGLLIGIWGVMIGCETKKVPLNEERFTALLIEMHRVDGTLNVEKGIAGGQELKNYAYYNELFRKYGISRADFDTCMYYYSAQNKLFSRMYDVVIDSLNRQLTSVDKVLNELKARDSVNYFPLLDTIALDSIYTLTIDSIVPGLYKFSTTLQFDSLNRDIRRWIVSYFLSPDQEDTLHIRDIYVSMDTVKRVYNWSQYVDSTYSTLVISYLQPISEAKQPKLPAHRRNAKPAPKVVRLKDFGGKTWNNQLFRPYISPKSEERLKQGLPKKK